MPQDDLAHDLDGSAGSRGVRRGMPSQIMGSHLHAYPLAGPFHHVPGGSILDRKYAAVEIESMVSNVVLEALGSLLWDEDHLSCSSALWAFERELLILHLSCP